MEKNNSGLISDAEWEVMRVVWANSPITSRQAIDILCQKMNWRESTVKTLLRRLVDKKALKIEKRQRKFLYHENISEVETIQRFSQNLLERLCHRKHNIALHHLVEESHLSRTDIKELIDLLEKKYVDAPEEVLCNCDPGQCSCQPGTCCNHIEEKV